VIAELLALMRASYMRKERVCYRENQAFSSEMRPTINKALLIYLSTSDPGNPEMPKEEHTCLCTRTSVVVAVVVSAACILLMLVTMDHPQLQFLACTRANGSAGTPIRS
jgi:hypothetical protein